MVLDDFAGEWWICVDDFAGDVMIIMLILDDFDGYMLNILMETGVADKVIC